ncbi:MAG TPA: hypothetical protein DCX14_07690 [Flavobacteriales bacterium]|jgi:hypothetical protein|nr:hypothetical protein [Flavobacteriales bacterium]HAW20046.1 hypothetical protein [Flavobacteriales bacterium]
MRIIVILLFLGLSLPSISQGYYWQSGSKEKKLKNLSVNGGVGLRMYFGDIQKKGSVFNKPKLAYGIGVRYQMRPKFGLSLGLEGRGYEGKAEHGGYPDAVDQMTGKLWGGHLMVEYSWLKWEDFTRKQFTDRDPVTKMNMYLGVGFGGALFNSSYTSRIYESFVVTDSLGADSTFFSPVDMSGSAGGFAMYVPVSLGFRYRIKQNIAVGFELQRQFYISKNVDALATKKFDGMGSVLVRVHYTFGQSKRKGQTKKVSKSGKFK